MNLSNNNLKGGNAPKGDTMKELKELFCSVCQEPFLQDDIKQIYCQDCLDADDDFDNLIDEVELD